MAYVVHIVAGSLGLIALSEPMLAEGPYGFHRRMRAIGIAPDAAEHFQRAVDHRSA